MHVVEENTNVIHNYAKILITRSKCVKTFIFHKFCLVWFRFVEVLK